MDIRQITGNERSCENCMHLDVCGRRAVYSIVPLNFEYRPGWNEDRFIIHMKCIIGQTCGNFEHNLESARRHFQRADARARATSGIPNQWDSEEN